MFSLSNKLDFEQKINRSLNIAKLFFQNKDYALAKEYIHELLEIKPDSNEAYKFLSQINEALGENELAIKNYQKSLELKSVENNFSKDNVYFSPSKLMTVNGRNNNNNKNSSNQSPKINTDPDVPKSIEKLIDSKFSMILNSIQVFKENSESSIASFSNRNNQEFLSLKQELAEINSKISIVSSKQEVLEKFLISNQQNNEKQTFKADFEKLSACFSKFSTDINQRFDELNEKIMNLRMNVNDDENYDDYYGEEEDDEENFNNYSQHNQDSSFQFGSTTNNMKQNPPLLKLSELFKSKQENIWTCQTCCVANEETHSNCASCKKPRYPNQQTNQNLSSPFRQQSSAQQTNTFFGTSKFPQFSKDSGSETSPASFTTAAKNNENPPLVNSLPLKDSRNGDNPLITTKPLFSFSKSSTFSFSTSNFFNSTAFNVLNPPAFSFSMPSTNLASSSNSMFQFPNTSNELPSFNCLGNQQQSINNQSPEKVQNPGLFSFANKNTFENIKFDVVSPPKSKDNTETEEIEHDQSSANNSSGDLILPIVNLPENYKHITGEEDEKELLQFNQAKLYILVDKEYKERGTGCLKILQNLHTQKLRLVMRRDKVHKTCLNTPLNSNIKFESRKSKFIFFQCIDFSDNKPTPQTFLLKLDINKFKNFVEEFFQNKSSDTDQSKPDDSNQKTGSNELKEKNIEKALKENDEKIEIIFMKEPKPEHRKMAESLKLPLTFYSYEEKPPCKGCIGCRVDELSWDDLTCSTLTNENTNDSSNSFGLFSNFSLDIPQTKVDTIQLNKGSSNAEINHSFISEKSKLLSPNYKHITGEEDEEVIYKERAKLFRFIKDIREYKERGIGEIKILKKHDKYEYRLLMRRDTILNVICNHKITPQLNFKDNERVSVSCIWATRDYSENPNGDDEIFLIKFKDETKKQTFLNNIQECKKNLKMKT